MSQWTRCDLDLVGRIVDDLRAAGIPLPESVALLDLRKRQCEALRSYRPVPFPSSSQLATAWGWETRTVMRKSVVHRAGKPAVSRVKRLLRTEWQDPYFADAWTAYRLKQTPNKPTTNASQTDETSMTHPQDALNTGNLDKNKPTTSQQQAGEKPARSHRRVLDADLLTATINNPTPKPPPPGVVGAVIYEPPLEFVDNTTLSQAIRSAYYQSGQPDWHRPTFDGKPMGITEHMVSTMIDALKHFGWEGTMKRRAIRAGIEVFVAENV
jgi:hypothetical protein